jgi:hypothetical protein
MMATYFIPASNLYPLREAVDKLNKRAKRLGVPPITFVGRGVVPERQLHEVHAAKDGSNWVTADVLATLKNPTGQIMLVHEVEIDGQAPSLDGWHFVATLAPLQLDDGKVENLTRCAPGESCPVEFRTRVGECDHCKAVRRRNETFVLRHDDGRHVCVGRQCIKDFLHFHHDPNALAGQAELLFSLQGLIEGAHEFSEGFGCGGAERTWRLDTVLAWTAAVIAKHGWLSRTKARDLGRYDATADRVFSLLCPPWGGSELAEWKAKRAELQPTPEQEQQVDAAIQWALELADDGDYLRNVNLIARCGIVRTDTMGIAASILVAHDRSLAQAKDHQSARSSAWQGTIGKRETFKNLTVTAIHHSENQWGVTKIHKLTDASGNRFTWFASEAPLTIGTTYTVKGTVKAHNEWKEIKETVLSRVAVISEVSVQE